MTHKTKGIVLKTIQYGETSIITTLYTELFGIQNYIVKGVRQSSKKIQGKANFFQPAAILQMEVYHNELKNLQFIKEYQWSYLYKRVWFDVVRNAVAMYLIELLHRSLKQPEANSYLFSYIENTLQLLDSENDALIANISLYFILYLSSALGFRIEGKFTFDTPVLNMREGRFTDSIPEHPHYLDGDLAQITSQLNGICTYKELEDFKLNHEKRGQLLNALQTYIKLHVAEFGEMRSLSILQEVLK